MSTAPKLLRRALLPAICLLALSGLVAAGSIAAGDYAAKMPRVKVRCPNKPGETVSCEIKGKLPRGKKGPQGPAGPAGPVGPAGANGTDGTDGTSGYEIVREVFPTVFVPNSNGRGLSAAQIVECPAGKRAVGGGADLGTNATQNGQQRQIVLSASNPTSTGDGWSVQLFNNSNQFDSSIDLEVYAICATVD